MSNRRDFLKTSALAGVAASVSTAGAFAAGADTIKVGLIGCGGRGTGAVHDMLSAEKRINGANPKVEIVAVADAFKDRAEGAVRAFKSKSPKSRYAQFVDQIKVTPETTFDGLDAYQKVHRLACDLVILATPPGFRPTHIEAAIKAGKHIFTEKPVASTRPASARSSAASRRPRRRTSPSSPAPSAATRPATSRRMKRIHDGAIGDIVAARVLLERRAASGCTSRQPGWSDDSSTRSATGTTSPGSAATTSSSSTSTTST